MKDEWKLSLEQKLKTRQKARELRNNATPSERKLWEALKDKALDGRKVQRWLHSESESDPGLPLAALDDLRADFWNAEIVQDEYGDFLGQITRRPARTLADRLEEMPDRLTQIEIVMENFRRLQGFEIELRSMRLSTDSFEEWQRLEQGESMGVIVNRQALGAAP